MVAREWNAGWGGWVMVEVLCGAATAVIVGVSGYLRDVREQQAPSRALGDSRELVRC